MRIAPILLAINVFWLANCLSVDQKKSSNDKPSLWPRVIDYLNQNDVIDAKTSVDLKELYRNELTDLDEQWLKKAGSKNEPIKKHEFFYEQLSLLNQHELSALPLSSAQDYQAIASAVIKKVEEHPSASSKNTWGYDQSGQIGFCFGRALLAHYYLLKAKVLPKDILKIFALGDLLVGGQFWQFHVAMGVRDRSGLLIVDPLYGEVTSVENWMNNIKSLEIKHPLSRARFFITDPRKFMPTSGIYNLKEILRPELLAYFNDLIHNLP